MKRILTLILAALALSILASAQQSHWAAADDATAKYITDMERKWAEGVCEDNGVVANLLAEDFQGTNSHGKLFTKADELKDEKSVPTSHGCGLDEAKIKFFGDNLAIVYGREHAVGKDPKQPNAKVCQVSGPTPGSSAKGSGRSSPHTTTESNVNE